MDTKKVLAESMQQLLQTKSLEDITVQDITEKSGICRTTFYRHFKDKYELIGYIFKAKNEKQSEEYTQTKDFLKTIEEAFRYISNEKNKTKNIWEYEGQNAPIDTFYDNGTKIFERKISPLYEGGIPEDIQNAIKFYVAGTVYFCKRWILGNFKESPEEIANVCCENMPEKLKEVLRECEKRGL